MVRRNRFGAGMGAWVGQDKVAIIGVGTTPFGSLYQDRDATRSAYDLAEQAFKDALNEASIDKDDIDGLFVARLPSYQYMAHTLGLRRLKLCNGFDGAGRMSAVAVQAAANAIVTGQAETVALLYGNNGRSVGERYGGGAEATPSAQYESAYGLTSPGAYCALMYRRYQETYNVPDGALAPVAINNRNHAKLNPNAVMQSDLDEDTYLSSRYITEPLRLFDYCLINDGGVALILTTVERARRLNAPLVTISATAACSDLGNFYSSDDFYLESCRQVAASVYSQAGIGPDDVDCVQIYDNFTPTVLFSLEGFGFCDEGTSWEWVKGGRLGLDGDLPTNTSGGHTSESYMQGWALHVEAVRQLRGEAGQRQVADCATVQYMCASPISSSHILRRLA